MKKHEFRRWRDLTLRMAATAFEITPRRKVKLLRELKEMFDQLLFYGYRDKWNNENWRLLASWDDRFDGVCFCDWVDSHFEEYMGWSRKKQEWGAGKFASMLHCCIRAGLDMASEPSAGVVGFSRADVENMYPRGVPAWIQTGFDTPWREIPLNAGLWL